MELLPFYLASFFEESPESYLSPSRGAVWGYFGCSVWYYGASGVCTRCMRRYSSFWFNGSVRLLDELTAERKRLYVMTAWW